MKKTFFTLLTITICIQGFSQNSIDHFHNLRNQFSVLTIESSGVSDRFETLGQYSEWNSGEHSNMGQGTLANNWNFIRDRFIDLEIHFTQMTSKFMNSEMTFHEIGNLLGNFDGTYGSLSGLPTLFDGNFSSLSGTPTTLAGYGITDAGDSPFSYNNNEAGGIEVADYTTASGSRAFAVGNDNLASGSSSTAMGRGTIASGDDSTALGANTEASGIASSAMGERTTASGDFSTAMGRDAVASNQDSTAMGNKTIASGVGSTAMGFGTIASGDFSTAIGDYTLSSGDFSTAMGKGTMASGGYSTAMGFFTTAEDYMTLALGAFNKADETPNPDNFSYQNTAFVIGNGTALDDKSDALVVKFNGDATLAGNLNINSDARLKANIISLGSTLSKLLQIDGKSYTMKKDESEKQKIGLLAQDIEKVFPELVSESHGVKSVNYQGLVPVLINALKEQEEKIKSQERKLFRLESLVQNLIDNQ